MSATKQISFLMGLFYGLTPVHGQKDKLSTRSGYIFGIKDINYVLMNSREIIQITELFMYFL